jgi:hypothetical protein
MGCPPAEQPPAGERIVEPAPPPTSPTYRDPIETMPPPQDTQPPPQDPPPLDDPQEPYPMDPQEPTQPQDPGQEPGDLPPPPPPQGS